MNIGAFMVHFQIGCETNRGGTLGIGRMISRGFVENGAKVYISSRDAKACEQACEELNKLGKGTAHAIPADFYKLEDCKKLAEELGKKEKSEFKRPIQGMLELSDIIVYVP